MSVIKTLIAIAILSCLLFFGWFCASVASNISNAEQEQAALVQSIRVDSFRVVIRDRYRFATGKAVNTSAKIAGSIFIELGMYNATGELVGTDIESIRNLSPGKTALFEARIINDTVTDVAIERIRAYAP